VIPFSVTNVPLRPLLQQASFLALGAPVYDNRPFLANSDLMIGQQFLGREMAKKLGPTSAVLLLRGHGDVVVAPSIRLAVFRAYYTEINARAQEQAIALGDKDVTYMTPEEGAAAEKLTESPASVNRSWQLWKQEIPG
jgi:HCOMODA/2-hydroxy-3-carboxy-muconic semialdehyde decarboxylase